MGARERALGAARAARKGKDSGAVALHRLAWFLQGTKGDLFASVSSLGFSCWRMQESRALGSSWWPGVSHLAGKEPVVQPQDLVVNELVPSQLGQRLFEILNGLSVAGEQRMKVSPACGGNLPASKPVLRHGEFRVSPQGRKEVLRLMLTPGLQ